MDVDRLIDFLSPAERDEAAQLLDELYRYEDARFPAQAAFVRDESPFLAALCAARSGKSYGVGLKLFRTAERIPGCKVLYLAKTKGTAKDIIWDDVLKPINRRLGLGAVPNESERSFRLKNGSQIVTSGADASDTERDKIFGTKYALIVVDEAEAFKTDLYKLVHPILKLRVADYRGQIVMIGTPHDVTSGLFYDVTRPPEQGGTGRDEQGLVWKVHRWTYRDNPYMSELIQAEIDQLTAMNPLVAQSDWFRQMYNGDWVRNDSNRVYKFKPGRNTYDQLPSFSDGRWVHKVGLDLGWKDDNAFVVAAWHPQCPDLFIPYASKRAGLAFDDVVEELEKLRRLYPFAEVVVDSANRQGVETMRKLVRGQINFVAAEKHDKRSYIGMFNGGLQTGNIRAHPAGAACLIDEWQRLVWDGDEESSRLPNHACDAALYVWRNAWPYLWKPGKPAYEPLNRRPESPEQRADRLRAEAAAQEERELGRSGREQRQQDREFWRDIRSEVQGQRRDKRLDGGW